MARNQIKTYHKILDLLSVGICACIGLGSLNRMAESPHSLFTCYHGLSFIYYCKRAMLKSLSINNKHKTALGVHPSSKKNNSSDVVNKI